MKVSKVTDFMGKYKGGLIALGVVALMTVGASDAAASIGLDGAGTEAKKQVRGVFSDWMWLFAFMPFLFAVFITWKVREYFEAKDEQSGQQEPRISRYAKMIAAFIGGVLICYILYGLFGKVFAGQEFGDMWEDLVVDFWTGVFSSGSGGTTNQ